MFPSIGTMSPLLKLLSPASKPQPHPTMIRPDIHLAITRDEAHLIVNALKAYRPVQTCTLQELLLNESKWALESHERKETTRTLCQYILSHMSR